MPEFTSITPYIKQISFYFQQEKYDEACRLSQECARKFPNNMVAHYLLAKSCFWRSDFKSSGAEALKAFNLSLGEDELAVTGVLLACSYYYLHEYEKGMEILRLLKTKLPANENVGKLKFIFALSLHDEAAAVRHLEEFYALNEKAASRMMFKFLGGANLAPSA
jgi:tetratricopeptide (TPR) repeat protein